MGDKPSEIQPIVSVNSWFYFSMDFVAIGKNIS